MSTQTIRHISVTEFRTKEKEISTSLILDFGKPIRNLGWSTPSELMLVSFERWDSNESNDGTITYGGVDGAELWTSLQVAKTYNTDDVN